MKNDLWQRILSLIEGGDFKFSAHSLDEVIEDDILVEDVVAGVFNGQIVEAYPDYGKGPCVLSVYRDQDDRPIHALWGIPKDASRPAVLITAYRPDPNRWADDFTRRVGE